MVDVVSRLIVNMAKTVVCAFTRAFNRPAKSSRSMDPSSFVFVGSTSSPPAHRLFQCDTGTLAICDPTTTSCLLAKLGSGAFSAWDATAVRYFLLTTSRSRTRYTAGCKYPPPSSIPSWGRCTQQSSSSRSYSPCPACGLHPACRMQRGWHH